MASPAPALDGLRKTSTESNTSATQQNGKSGPRTVIENEKGKRIYLDQLPDYVSDEAINLPANSIKVLEKRYLRKDLDGTLLETPAGMFYRIAYHLAQVEKEHGGDVEGMAKTFYDLMTERRFYPNSPTFTGAGTPLGQLAACFTADMRVSTEHGLKRIADLQVGDRVLTHAGRYRPVTELFQRAYNGELLRIKVKLIGTTIEVTPEHPILTPTGWKRAGDLRVGDQVAIGVPSGTRPTPHFDLAESVYAEGLEIQTEEEAVRVRRPVDTTYVTANASATAQISMPPLQSRTLITKTFGIELPAPDQRYVRPMVQRDGDRVFFSIERIESAHFGGTVYNCEVDEDHSYVTEGVVVHNCFVLPIEDDMGKSSDGIFSTLRVAALIQQTGGGNGFSFSRLRPKNDVVHTSAGRATGPVGFLRVYDQAFGEIAQGGSRRGANMGVLRVDHPDIEEFITSKAEEGTIANFNISVAITDEFMQAVKDDSDFNLRNPRDGKVWKTVRARELFDKIIKYAHHNGEPGALFIDAANRSNPVPHLYDLEATNPCGEQWLGPYENCCLGSVNLAVHAKPGADGKMVVDWALLRRSVEESTQFLDNVVSANAYVPAVPEVAQAAYRARRIGLGIMGLGDLMYQLGIRYGSEEGQEFAAQIMEFVRFHCMAKSIELAEERQPFLAFEGSIYDPQQPGGMKWRPPQPLTPYRRDWGRPALDWGQIVRGIEQHGIRNAAQTTVAPTGTIATVCGCEGYGCEPVFALGYVRHFKDGDKDVELLYTSPLFEAALNATKLSEEHKAAIKQHVATYGTCQDLDDLPEHIRHTFVVSGDITAEEHVRMQAAIQAFVDNSISKTINFFEGATEAEVAKAYLLAWELGCKGLTVYVTGSRQEVVLETKATQQKKGETAETSAPSQNGVALNGSATATSAKPVADLEPIDSRLLMRKRPRPNRLQGSTYRKETPLGRAYITVNSDERGEPLEVFLNVGKAGSEVSAVSEAIGRLISLVLRMPGSQLPNERLRWIIDELADIGGGRPLGFGANRVRSLPDGIAQVLAEHLSELPPSRDGLQAEQLALPIQAQPLGDICPDCGEATLLNVEGCRKCQACGYSEC
jgi:ribonucleoside-diphosphate reductase alpha chain